MQVFPAAVTFLETIPAPRQPSLGPTSLSVQPAKPHSALLPRRKGRRVVAQTRLCASVHFRARVTKAYDVHELLR
jgi:hypothetical protein